MDKFKNKYRIPSNRKPNYDYSSNGLYFLTIVTQHRICNLGSIVNGKMTLSEFGKIVEMEWFKSFEIRDELFLDEFILMPNHLHAIVEICNGNNNDENNARNGGHDENGIDGHGGRDDHDRHDRIGGHDRIARSQRWASLRSYRSPRSHLKRTTAMRPAITIHHHRHPHRPNPYNRNPYHHHIHN
ncbi:MAG: hypothetical protein IPP29_24655 [Bacteroidetes bacterium]|nr:hypothetical protein [Bacteroidota bacterium]